MKSFQLIFTYTWSLIITAVSMLAQVGTQLLIPWIVKLLIARVTEPVVTLASMNYVATLALIVLVTYLAPLLRGASSWLGYGGRCTLIYLRTHATPVATVLRR